MIESNVRDGVRKSQLCLLGLVENKKKLKEIEPVIRRLSLVVEEDRLVSESQFFYRSDGSVVYISLTTPGRRFDIDRLENWIGFGGNNPTEIASNLELMSFLSPMEHIPYHFRRWSEKVKERREEKLFDLF